MVVVVFCNKVRFAHKPLAKPTHEKSEPTVIINIYYPQCYLCPEDFPDTNVLKRHIRRVHQTKPSQTKPDLVFGSGVKVEGEPFEYFTFPGMHFMADLTQQVYEKEEKTVMGETLNNEEFLKN